MTATEQPEWVTEKVSLPTLTAMVVGLMIGSGGFLLPRGFGVLGAIVALTIAGTGMLMLAFVFQRLAMRKPDPARHLRLCQGRVRRLRRVQFGARLLIALLFAADALDFMVDLTAALSLIGYLLAATFALKLAHSGYLG